MCERCAVEKDIYLPRLATLEKKRLMNPTEMYLRLSIDDNEPFDFIPETPILMERLFEIRVHLTGALQRSRRAQGCSGLSTAKPSRTATSQRILSAATK